MACEIGLQVVPGLEAEPVLVDPSEARWKVVEPKQLQDRHDLGTWRCGGHPRAYTFQGHIFPHLGRSFLGESLRIRGINEIQKAYARAEIRPQPDSEQEIHALVVPHHQ